SCQAGRRSACRAQCRPTNVLKSGNAAPAAPPPISTAAGSECPAARARNAAVAPVNRASRSTTAACRLSRDSTRSGHGPRRHWNIVDRLVLRWCSHDGGLLGLAEPFWHSELLGARHSKVIGRVQHPDLRILA